MKRSQFLATLPFIPSAFALACKRADAQEAERTSKTTLVTFIAERGEPGFGSNEQWAIDMKGLNIEKAPKFITNDFKTSISDIITKIEKVEIVNGAVMVTAEIHSKYHDMYPAVGIQTIKWETVNGVKTAVESELKQVSLCVMRNADHEIKTIGEQLATNK